MNALTEYLATRGAIAGLAQRLAVTPSAVSQWLTSRVPAERVLDVEKATGVPRQKIRPDIYPDSAP